MDRVTEGDCGRYNESHIVLHCNLLINSENVYKLCQYLSLCSTKACRTLSVSLMRDSSLLQLSRL